MRLLGTMLFQSVLLGFCILLYVNWSWSHFENSYESAMFYAFAGFSVQAAFYFIYRAVFEDSSDHRRQLKRMRTKNRQRMAHLKFQQEKAQLETVLNQQMGIYQANLGAAMADNVITPQESEVLGGKLGHYQSAYGSNPNATTRTTSTAGTSNTTPTSYSRILGDRPPSNYGHPSGTEADYRPIFADIIARLDRIESEPTRNTRPSSSGGSREPRASRREPSMRCNALTLEGGRCSRMVRGRRHVLATQVIKWA